MERRLILLNVSWFGINPGAALAQQRLRPGREAVLLTTGHGPVLDEGGRPVHPQDIGTAAGEFQTAHPKDPSANERPNRPARLAEHRTLRFSALRTVKSNSCAVCDGESEHMPENSA